MVICKEGERSLQVDSSLLVFDSEGGLLSTDNVLRILVWLESKVSIYALLFDINIDLERKKWKFVSFEEL